ncbi:MAG: GTP-binding protein [Candidatus Lokiarchaeota archaeon]|nr:GTP-binding protein [Candidatus Lokiarchaeota archaeon]
MTEPMTKLKIVIAGDPAVGKTTLIKKFSTKKFEEDYKMTVGFQISKIEKIIGYDNVQFMVYDIAGQERFKIMRHRFYAGADGCILVFDLTNKDSLKNIEMWYKECINLSENSQVKLILVGNKHDLHRVVPREIGKKVADVIKVPYYETSAKNGLNVDEIFEELYHLVVKS